ncbi:MAG TPA: hypothetical protein VJV79_09700 [Polyangiaceae bacterium]|nr:hypothetical protein [Polyangiaceae bacterium]
MNSPFLRTFFCSGLTLSVALLTTIASADAADDLTAKGENNVNDQRPQLPAVAANSPSGVFGDRGQITISSDAGLSISSTSTSGVDGSTTKLTLLPALDYFVANNISVGGFIGVDYTTTSGQHETVFQIGPRVGYNLAFSERFSFWPKLGFSYSSSSTSTTAPPPAPPGTTNDVSGSHLALNVFAPVMFHPVQHFFLGFGPALDTDLTGDARKTAIAGRLTIGGWL